MDFTAFFPHRFNNGPNLRILVVRFSGGLPYRIEEAGNRTPSFLIPTVERLDILEFMEDQPQHIIKRSESKWVLRGIPPPLKHKCENRYRTFLSCAKQALKSSHHQWSRLPLVELQKQPQVKEMYERYFKFNPNPITPESVMTKVRTKLQTKRGTSMPHRSTFSGVHSRDGHSMCCERDPFSLFHQKRQYGSQENICATDKEWQKEDPPWPEVCPCTVYMNP